MLQFLHKGGFLSFPTDVSDSNRFPMFSSVFMKYTNCSDGRYRIGSTGSDINEPFHVVFGISK